MGLYNFQPRFEPKILDGTKRHTIRADRIHEDEPGDTMHCFVGARTKACRLIQRVPCTRKEVIRILPDYSVLIAGEQLAQDEKDRLAIADGFESFAEMMSFWKGRLPFQGKIYHWR